jgi:hypothetical protein
LVEKLSFLSFFFNSQKGVVCLNKKAWTLISLHFICASKRLKSKKSNLNQKF